MKKYNEKGITLIALVVTIIILIILASITAYSGIDIINNSKLTKFTTEMKIMQTQVNSIYDKYKNDEIITIKDDKDYKGEEILNIGLELTVNDEISSQAETVLSDSLGITEKTGYKYWSNDLVKKLGIEGNEEAFFVNVAKRSIVSYEGLKYKGKMYYALEQVSNNLYNVEYNENTAEKPTFELNIEKLNSEDWKIEVSNINYDGYIEKWEVKYQLVGTEYWSISEDHSFVMKAKEGDSYLIKVCNGLVESELKMIKTEFEGYVFNQTDDENANLDGNGTIESPYQIKSIEDLVTLSNKSNSGESNKDKYIELKNNLSFAFRGSYIDPDRIDFGDINENTIDNETLFEELTTGKGFKPISSNINYVYADTLALTGVIDGKGHCIDGLYVQNRQYAGFISYALALTINNLDLTDVNINTVDIDGDPIITTVNEAGFISMIPSGIETENLIFENCKLSGNIKGQGGFIGNNRGNINLIGKNLITRANINGSGQVGSIVGDSSSKEINLENCYNEGNVSGDSIVAGLVGRTQGSEITIKNSSNKGKIETTGNIVGGIIARSLASELIIDKCINEGEIKSESGGFVGGIAGQINNGKISNSSNLGNVLYKGENSAGILGLAYNSNTVTISKCYNKGNIEPINENTTSNIAGIVGDGTVAIDNCYNTGRIVGSNNLSGIANSVTTIENCYNIGEIIQNIKIEGIEDKISGIINKVETLMSNCYSIGKIKLYNEEQSNSSPGIGALASDITTANLVNNYYLNGIFPYGVGGTAERVNLAGKFEVKEMNQIKQLMEEKLTVLEEWVQYGNEEYPVLSWEK